MNTKGKGKGQDPNIFYNPYYYPYSKGKGKGTAYGSKSKSTKHGRSYSQGMYKEHKIYYQHMKTSKDSKSRRLDTKSSNYFHRDSYFWYTQGLPKGKGKGQFFDRLDEVDSGDDYYDLPICPPPRPHPPTQGRPPAPHSSGSYKSADPPALSPSARDDDNVPIGVPQPTRTPLAGITPVALPPVQLSQENPAPAGSQASGPSEPQTSDEADDDDAVPTEPVVANWGEVDSSGRSSEGGVRAALFAGAGVAAGLIAVIATYIYRREKQYVAHEMKMINSTRTPRLGALPRQPHIPMAHTMSATVATESEMAAFAKH